jgi:hypothetical protein
LKYNSKKNTYQISFSKIAKYSTLSKAILWDCYVELEDSTAILWDCYVELEDSTAILWDCYVELEDSTAILWDSPFNE